MFCSFLEIKYNTEIKTRDANLNLIFFNAPIISILFCIHFYDNYLLLSLEKRILKCIWQFIHHTHHFCIVVSWSLQPWHCKVRGNLSPKAFFKNLNLRMNAESGIKNRVTLIHLLLPLFLILLLCSLVIKKMPVGCPIHLSVTEIWEYLPIDNAT